MRKSNSAQRLADAIRRSQLSEKRAIREAIELQKERERTGYRVELQWEEPDMANASLTEARRSRTRSTD